MTILAQINTELSVDETLKEIGNDIYIEMKKRRMSQDDLAQEAHVNVSPIAKICKGESINLTILITIMSVLNLGLGTYNVNEI